MKSFVWIALATWMANIIYIKTSVLEGRESQRFYFGPGWGVAIGLVVCVLLGRLIMARKPSDPPRKFRFQWPLLLLLLPLLLGKQVGDSYSNAGAVITVRYGFGDQFTPLLLGVSVVVMFLWQKLKCSRNHPLRSSDIS
jgi:hypothetical protein